MKVSFLGAGLYGEALGKLAELNEHEVKYYDPYRFPDIKLKDVVAEAEAIVYVAPAEAYQELLSELPAEGIHRVESAGTADLLQGASRIMQHAMRLLQTMPGQCIQRRSSFWSCLNTA